MQDLIRYVILGIPVGCVFGLVAVSLVLTYKTSGVFNLAFAAQAYLAAAVYYDVHVRHGWPIIPAFVFVVLVVSPFVGFLLDRLVFRWLRGASPIGKLVSALGLLVAVPQVINVWLGPNQLFGIKGIWWNDNALYHLGDYTLDGRQMAIMVSVAAVVLLLVALFRWTAIGLQMRAVVESPRLTELAGVNADRASSAAWMISSAMAGLAGVLLAPFSASLNVGDFTTLLISAIAAAAFARLVNIPLALLGGILLGITQALLAGYLPPASLLAQGLKPSLPFAVLFLLLLFWPGLRNRRETTDPLSGADPPPPSLASASRSRAFTHSTHILGAVFVLFMVYVALERADAYWLSLLTLTLVYSVIFLSITVITGMGGQISLCQATFAGIGAFTTAQFVSALGSNVILGMIIGAVIAAAVGALLAIPVLRLAGIYLSLATLAFALMFENVLVPHRLGRRRRHAGAGAAPAHRPVRPLERQDVLRLLHDRADDRQRAGDLRAPGHDRPLPRCAARQRDRRAVDRDQPVQGQGRRVRGVRGHRRPRRRTARDAEGDRPASRLQLLPRLRLRRDRGVDRGPHRGGRDQRRHRVRDPPRHPLGLVRHLADLGVRPVRVRRDPVRPPPRGHAGEREAELDRVLPAPARQALGPPVEVVRWRLGRRQGHEPRRSPRVES